MNEVYSVDGVKETIYFENIQKDLKLFSEIHPTEYSADEAEVRDIRSVTIVPENVYVENQNLFEYGVEFLKKPNMSREARSLIKSKLEKSYIKFKSLSKISGRSGQNYNWVKRKTEKLQIFTEHSIIMNLTLKAGKDVEYCLMNN